MGAQNLKPKAKARELYNSIIIAEKNRISHDDVINICRTILDQCISYAKDEYLDYLNEVKNALNDIE
ncbi:MAG: hypothetical protein JNL24_15110 [Bacteroidia bacterium]|nr:hypothetical protein [Bacteroidia bacterium]